MDLSSLLQAVAALAFVISLIGLSAWVLRRFALDKNLLKGGKAKRLSVDEFLYLDNKTKIALVKKDSEEFLILLGQNNQTVISSDSPEFKATNKVPRMVKKST